MKKTRKLSAFLLSAVMLVQATLTAFPVFAQTKETEQDIANDHSSCLTEYDAGTTPKQGEGLAARILKNNKKRSGSLNLEYLAIMVEFSDLPDVHMDDAYTVTAANAILNDGGMMSYTGGDIPIVSLKDYIKKYSYGAFVPTAKIFPRENGAKDGKVISYTMSKSRSYYMPQSSTNPSGYTNRTAREKEMLDEILAAVQLSIENDTTASGLDADGDGAVDAINFFMESPNSDTVKHGDLLWSHKGNASTSMKIHGKSIDAYNVIRSGDSSKPTGIFSNLAGKPSRAHYSVIHHEYLHTFGLPDLYRANNSGNPVGFFDVMAANTVHNPQGMLSLLSRDWLNWGATVPTITTTQKVTLSRPKYTNRSEQVSVKIKSPLNPKQYVIAEFYEKRENATNNTTTQDGVVLYRVNEDGGGSNIDGTADGKNDYVFVYRPNEPTLGIGNGDLTNAVVPLTVGSSYGKERGTESKATWDKDTLYYVDGANSGIKVEVTAASTDTVTLNITVPTLQGDGSETNPYQIASISDFDTMRNNPAKFFELSSDLNMTGADFASINSFEGTFDGNGHTLSNLTSSAGGLFNTLSGEVKNLTIKDATITRTTSGHAGILAASLQGKATNIQIIGGSVTGADAKGLYDNAPFAGSLAGTVGIGSIISNCSSSATVNQGVVTEYIGGLIGLDQGGTISNSFFAGKLTLANGKYAGGLIGRLGSIPAQMTTTNATNCAYNSTSAGVTIAYYTGAGSAVDNDTNTVGYRLDSSIDLDLNGVSEVALPLTSYPTVTATPNVTIDPTSIAIYDTASNKLKATAAGTATVTVSIPLGTNFMPLTSKLTVTGDSNKPVDNITLNKTTLALAKGEKEALTVTFDPADADDKTVTWSSSDDTVATVDTNGNVTAVASGTATITATTANSKAATCVVSVTNPVSGITLNKATLALTKGANETLTVTFDPSDADDKTVTWSSSDDTVATVDTNGNVTAVASGTATITATTTNSKTATCVVSVTNPATSIDLGQASEVSMLAGTTLQLNPTLKPADTTDIPAFTYSSSNPAIVTISNTGLLTAVAKGETTITVTATLPTRADRTLTATLKVVVTLTANQELFDKATEAQEKLNDQAFHPTAPQEFEDNLQTLVTEGLAIWDDIDVSDADKLAKRNEIQAALDLFHLVPALDEIKVLITTDLSGYDTGTTQAFINASATANTVLANPLTHAADISTTLDSLKIAKNAMVLLNADELTVLIQTAMALDLALYQDGVSKDAFTTALTDAAEVLTSATTNNAYTVAKNKLQTALDQLKPFLLATDHRKDEIKTLIDSLQEKIDSALYTNDTTDAMKKVVKDAKDALEKGADLLASEADTVYQAMLLYKDMKPDKTESIPSEPSKPESTPSKPESDSSNSDSSSSNNASSPSTGDFGMGLWWLFLILSSGACVILTSHRKKQ